MTVRTDVSLPASTTQTAPAVNKAFDDASAVPTCSLLVAKCSLDDSGQSVEHAGKPLSDALEGMLGKTNSHGWCLSGGDRSANEKRRRRGPLPLAARWSGIAGAGPWVENPPVAKSGEKELSDSSRTGFLAGPQLATRDTACVAQAAEPHAQACVFMDHRRGRLGPEAAVVAPCRAVFSGPARRRGCKGRTGLRGRVRQRCYVGDGHAMSSPLLFRCGSEAFAWDFDGLSVAVGYVRYHLEPMSAQDDLAVDGDERRAGWGWLLMFTP